MLFWCIIVHSAIEEKYVKGNEKKKHQHQSSSSNTNNCEMKQQTHIPLNEGKALKKRRPKKKKKAQAHFSLAYINSIQLGTSSTMSMLWSVYCLVYSAACYVCMYVCK